MLTALALLTAVATAGAQQISPTEQQIIQYIDAHNDEIAIVETVVSLAHKLTMRVVAEGVESDEHLALVRESGCDLLQGHAFGRPMSADDFAAWWSRRLARNASGPRVLEPPPHGASSQTER